MTNKPKKKEYRKYILSLALISILLLIALIIKEHLRTQTPRHDIAIIDVTLSSNEAYPTWVIPLNINVAVRNNGIFTETFHVTVYYNQTLMNNQTVTDLPPRKSITLTFIWGIPDIPFAYPYPTYTISANASTVTNETNTTNNFLTDRTVKVKWPGDADGDGHIWVMDLYLFGKSWYRKVGGPEYNPRTNFNNAGEVNVEDLHIMAETWGRGPLD